MVQKVDFWRFFELARFRRFSTDRAHFLHACITFDALSIDVVVVAVYKAVNQLIN